MTESLAIEHTNNSELSGDESTALVNDKSKKEPDRVKSDGTPTAYGWRWLHNKLQQPMPAKVRKGYGNLQFEYITARQVQDRLDEAVGPGNWSTQYTVLHHDPERNIVVVECKLTIFGVTKANVGTNNNPDIPELVPSKNSPGELVKNPAWENEPFKASFSDSFKRAAVEWSIGRFLYHD